MPNSMKVEAPDLSEQIKWVSHGVNKLNASPYVRLTFSDGVLEMTSADEANAYKGKLDVREHEGEFEEVLLDGEMLSKVPKVLRGNSATLTFSKTNMTVTSGVTKADIPIMKNERASRMPQMPDSVGTVLSEDFAKAVKQVSKSASSEIDKSLIILTCVLVEIVPSESVIKLTATDRFNLAHKTIEYTPRDAESDPISFALKGRALNQAVADMMNGGIITIHAVSETKKFGLTNDKKSVYLGVTGEDYVKYERLMNGKTVETAKVEKRAWNGAIGDVSTFNKQDYITCTFDKNNINVKGSNMEMDIDAIYSGPLRIVKFKTENIRKAMGFLKDSSMNVHFPENAKQGIVIRELNNNGHEDTSFFGLLMPMV